MVKKGNFFIGNYSNEYVVKHKILAYILDEELKGLISLSDQVNGHVVGLLVVALLRLDYAHEQRVQDPRRDLIGLVEQRMQDVEEETLDSCVRFVTVKQQQHKNNY